jgi:hypothetical protein
MLNRYLRRGWRSIEALARRQPAQGLGEYALLLVGVALLALAAVLAVGARVTVLIERVSSSLFPGA